MAQLIQKLIALAVRDVLGCGQFRHVEPLPVSFGVPEVVLKLLIEPALGAGVESDGETDRHLRADTRAAAQNAGQSFAAHAQRPRDFRYGHVQGLQAKRLEHLTGLWRIMHFHNGLSGSFHSRPDLRICRSK
jgi:hypothetical protein